jgi:hypothetical protein
MSKTATQRRVDLDAAVDSAKVEERRIRDHRQDAEQRAQRLRAELAARLPVEFDDTGAPVAKTEAARLAGELAATTGTLWADRIRAAEQRTRTARLARDRHTADNIRQLVAEAEPDARAAVDDFHAAVEQVDKAIVKLIRMVGAWSPLISTVPGLDPRTELATYDDLNGLRRLLRPYRADLPLPLPKSIATPEGQQPPRVLYRGGWVSPGNASSSEEQERQNAERVEREAARARRSPAVR